MSTETGVRPTRPDQRPAASADAVATLERGTATHLPTRGADAPEAPPAAADRRGRLRRALAFGGPIVALVLGMKALVYSLGVVTLETIGDRTFPHFADRLAIWNTWDAQHYLALAEHGYVTTGDAANRIVFFPGYPLAVRLAHAVTPGDYLTAAFVVSGVASIAAALLLGALVRRDGGDNAQATRAAWFLLIFPTAYFLHLPYTESLFLTFVLGAFVAARSGHWRTAGLVGMLAAFTRINGVLLLPALAVEAYLQYRKTRQFDQAWLWIGFVALGLLLYLDINQHYFGNPLHFQDIQREHWSKQFANPIPTIKGMVEGMHTWKPGDRQMLVVQELLFLGIGLVAGIVAFFRTRPSYAVWALLNVALFASTSFVQSTPRYAITIFPIFLLLAQIKRQMWLAMLVSAWSLAMLAWFTTIFAKGGWAF